MPDEIKVMLPVQFRPDKSAWIGVIFVGAMGLFFLIGPIFALNDPSPRNPPSFLEAIVMTIFFCAIGLALLSLAVWGELWIQRGAIIADETGLHWRSVRKWRHATWPQVRDYYDETLGRERVVIETDAGPLRISSSTVTNALALRDAIHQNAKWSRAKEWGVLGTRIEADWPRTFGYNPTEYLSNSRITCAIAFFWLFGFCWVLAKSWKGWMDIWQYSGPALVIVGLTLYFVWTLLYPYVALMTLSMLREVRLRTSERITVTSSGLIFESDTQRIECTWEEISDYYRDPMLATYSGDDRYVVVTVNGTFAFTLIENRFLLGEIIKRHAKNALYQHWRDYRPQHETGKKGERLYIYRTRYNRALMLLPMSFIPISLLVVSSSIELGNPGTADDLSVKIMMGFYGLASAIICAAYFVGSIEISESGITQRGLKGKKFLNWPDITQIRGTKIGGYELIGNNTRLGFYGMIGDSKILRDEIERRAINAEVLASWAQQSPYNGT